MTLKQLEKMLIEHIEASGFIQTDIKWIKRAVLGWYGLAGVIIIEELARHLWR